MANLSLHTIHKLGQLPKNACLRVPIAISGHVNRIYWRPEAEIDQTRSEPCRLLYSQ